MVISGLLLEAAGDVDSIIRELKGFDGLEVTEIFPDNKIGLLLETDSTDRSIDISTAITRIPGVSGLSLIYHNFEDEVSRFDIINNGFDTVNNRSH